MLFDMIKAYGDILRHLESEIELGLILLLLSFIVKECIFIA